MSSPTDNELERRLVELLHSIDACFDIHEALRTAARIGAAMAYEDAAVICDDALERARQLEVSAIVREARALFMERCELAEHLAELIRAAAQRPEGKP